MGRTFVVLNPVAGADNGNSTEQVIQSRMAAEIGSEVYRTTGQERVQEIVRAAVQRGFERVVAAGGDGTVSATASGLVGSDVPLGIIPAGTGNTLARDLGIPLNTAGALALLSGEHELVEIDAIRLGQDFYFLNLGIGLSSKTMRNTERESKRRFGRIAYLWTAVQEFFRCDQHLFFISVDGRERRVRATEVLIANSAAVGVRGLRWGPDVRLDDGRLDLCVGRARTIGQFLVVLWRLLWGRPRRGPTLYCLPIESNVSIRTPQPLPVQADGEVIGHTPVEVAVVPRAVRVIVPKREGNYDRT